MLPMKQRRWDRTRRALFNAACVTRIVAALLLMFAVLSTPPWEPSPLQRLTTRPQKPQSQHVLGSEGSDDALGDRLRREQIGLLRHSLASKERLRRLMELSTTPNTSTTSDVFNASWGNATNSSQQLQQQELDKLQAEIQALRSSLEHKRHEIEVEEQMLEHKEGEVHTDLEIEWSWTALAASVVLLCCCALCQFACAAFSIYVAYIEGVASTYDTLLGEDKDASAGDDKDSKITGAKMEGILRIVHREMRMMMLYPFIPLLALLDPRATCKDGLPTWIYLIYFPLLIRSKLIELRILRQLDASLLSLAFGFALGALDHADWVTDGFFPVQAYLCDDVATDAFARAMQQSAFPFLAPLVLTLRFWGIATILLSAATFAQQAGGSHSKLQTGEGVQFDCLHAAADVPGFGGLAAFCEKEVDTRAEGNNSNITPLILSVTKVLIENDCQFWLQASFIGLTWKQTDMSAKSVLVFSVGVGLASAIYKVAMTLKMSVRFLGSGYDDGPQIGIVGIVVQIPSLFMIVWTILKLYFAFACDETHLWNLTSGCVVAT